MNILVPVFHFPPISGGGVVVITDIINKSVETKKTEDLNWEKNFITEYKKIKNKLFKYGSIFLTLYFVIFVSPLPYYLGQKLIINDTDKFTKKTDGIIVDLNNLSEQCVYKIFCYIKYNEDNVDTITEI